MGEVPDNQLRTSGLADWRRLVQSLYTQFPISDFSNAVKFLVALEEAQVDLDHLNIHVTPAEIRIALCTRTSGNKITAQDIDLAQTISAIARKQGLVADPASVTQLELALDTTDQERITPFWAALLTDSTGNVARGEVVDPSRLLPIVWFQKTEPHDPPKQRWHIDLWVAPETVEERVARVLNAGGVIVDDSHAPSFIVLADKDGNKACICTIPAEQEPGASE